MAKINTKEVILHSAYETFINGYTKRSEDSDCTADAVIDAISSDKEIPNIEDVHKRIVEWSEYIQKQSGEYFEDVKREIEKPSIDEIKVGLISSSFASFDRQKKFEALNARDKQSEFLGEEGDVITFNITDHKLIKTGFSKFGNKSNKWYLYKIYDDCDNVIMYFSNYDCETEFENSNSASAIVSKLTTYNGIKQTNVTKLKFL